MSDKESPMKSTPESMTGYACVEKLVDGVSLKLEIKSVNSRGQDSNFKLPYCYYPFEPELQTRLRGSLGRGRVDVYIKREVLPGAGASKKPLVKINQPLFESYWEGISKLFAEGSAVKSLDPENLGYFILNRSELFHTEEDLEQVTQEHAVLVELLDEAIRGLHSSRAKEGQELVAILKQQSSQLREFQQEISSRQKGQLKVRYENLVAKLKGLMAELDFSSERVEQEAAMRVERSDVTEELDRISSHLTELDHELASSASGKKIEFYTQELRREFNTISSKSFLAKDSQAVVAAKLIIEQIREQSLNLA